MDATRIVRATELEVCFGQVVALGGINLAIARGECVWLAGPNGAGKSTLLNVLNGICRPTHGSVEVLGVRTRADHSSPFWPFRRVPVRTSQLARRGVARTFQTPRLFSSFTVAENVGIAARDASHPSRGRINAALERFGLSQLRDKLVDSLSPGERRRVELARAVASASTLLLLDEPSVGLDALERKQLVENLSRLLSEGMTLIVAEHVAGTISSIATRIVVFGEGMVTFDGTVDDAQSVARLRSTYIVGGRDI